MIKGQNPEHQRRLEKVRFEKRQEKPLDFNKIKEDIEEGLQKTLI